MSNKPSYDGEIPWDKMDKWAVNWTAFIKAILIVLISSAVGALALYQSHSANKLAKDNSKLILNLSESNTRLVEENKDLRYEIVRAKDELALIQKEMLMKDDRIVELELREKQLLVRIEELEKQIKES